MSTPKHGEGIHHFHNISKNDARYHNNDENLPSDINFHSEEVPKRNGISDNTTMNKKLQKNDAHISKTSINQVTPPPPPSSTNIHLLFQAHIKNDDINDYSCLLSDFLRELEVPLNSEKDEIENEDDIIYKADVLFFAKELQWRFEELKKQWNQFLDAVENVHHEDNLKEETEAPQSQSNSDNECDGWNTDTEEAFVSDIAQDHDVPERKEPISCIPSHESFMETTTCMRERNTLLNEDVVENPSNENSHLQNRRNDPDPNTNDLQISVTRLEKELLDAKEREETSRLQLLYAQSRLKYLEIAFHSHFHSHSHSHLNRHPLKPTQKHSSPNLLQHTMTPSNPSFKPKSAMSSFSPLVDAIAHASVHNETKEVIPDESSFETSHHCAASTTLNGVHEESSYQDLPMIEEMRKQIIELAEALEVSEKERAVLFDERIREKEENAKLIEMMGKSLKHIIHSKSCTNAPELEDEHYDLD